MDTYISQNKFQFITDFSKYKCTNLNGDEIQLDFNLLSIYDRILLSAYLTLLCKNKSRKEHQNWYNVIFNFNQIKRYYKVSYYESFISDLSQFVKNNPYYITFIKEHFDQIVNNKTFIYRQQLNRTQMDVLYSFKFQRNYKSLMNVLYILGVSKQNIKTNQLNKIPLSYFYKNNSTLSKKLVSNIFKQISAACGKQIGFEFKKDMVYFGNGFQMKQTSEYYSEDQKRFQDRQQIKNFFKEI